MKRIKLLVVFAVFLGLVIAPALANYAMAAPQTNCPVMGGKINQTVYTDYQGKRIYFCCTGCIDTFKKDPAKYMKKLEADKVDLAPAPAK